MPAPAPPAQEPHLRSLLKGLSWRLVATTTIIILAWWKTGDYAFALELGAAEFVIKLGLYYAHERAWLRVPTGTFRLSTKQRRARVVKRQQRRAREAERQPSEANTPS